MQKWFPCDEGSRNFYRLQVAELKNKNEKSVDKFQIAWYTTFKQEIKT